MVVHAEREASVASPVSSSGARHRRRRGRPRGRHRLVYAPSARARWMIPAGLALVILVVVTTVLLVTDVTTS